MKKIFLLFASIIMSCGLMLAAEAQREIRVSNVVEFIQALGSDRTIIVDWHLDFDNELTEIHNFNPALLPQDDKYEYDKIAKMQDRCFMYENTDGPELILAGIKNLTIKGGIINEHTLLRIRPRYAYVLNFIYCSGITIENLVMGHTDEGTCDGGVLSFERCKDIHINNCDLYGCGTEGIGCRDTEGLTMTNSQIRDCSYQIMTLRNCKDFLFDRCFFFRNRQFSLLDIFTSSHLTFRDCVITHNEGTLFNLEDDEEVIFDHCNIMHDVEKRGNYYNALFKKCTWSNEFGVKRESY